MNEMLQNWTNGSATNSSLSSYAFPMSVFFMWLANAILLGIGNVLNLVVMYVMFRSRKVRSSISSFLIFHLSLTHVLYHMVVPILRIINPPHSCKAIVLIALACSAALFGSLASIAWDRHRNVLQPFKSLAPRRLKTYLLLVAGIWFYAFLTSTPFIYSVKTQPAEICWENKNGTETECRKYTFCYPSTDWKTQLSKTLFFIMAFAAPFMYMLIIYTKIAVNLWKRSRAGKIHGAVAKCKAKSIRLMVIALLVFAVCWGLNFIADLLRVYGVLDNLSFESDIMLEIWCEIAKASSACLNPAVYAFFSPEFRKNCVKFCCCCCRFHRRCHGVNRVQPVL